MKSVRAVPSADLVRRSRRCCSVMPSGPPEDPAGNVPEVLNHVFWRDLEGLKSKIASKLTWLYPIFWCVWTLNHSRTCLLENKHDD